nr:RecName: Full=Fibrinogen alpha chain; Contains: RecName: Full=Fibrinopeptide A [Vombatus ursinus]
TKTEGSFLAEGGGVR